MSITTMIFDINLSIASILGAVCANCSALLAACNREEKANYSKKRHVEIDCTDYKHRKPTRRNRGASEENCNDNRSYSGSAAFDLATKARCAQLAILVAIKGSIE